MQVKIKLGKEWWLLPSNKEFTKKELDLFSDVPYVAPLEHGESVRFFDMQPKKAVKQIISQIGSAYYQGFKPTMKAGHIYFKELGSK